MISIFKQMEHSETMVAGFRALRKAYLELTDALPKGALPANPELSVQCKAELDTLEPLLDDGQETRSIDQAGKVALRQFEAIYHSNRAAIEERDAALKDVVASVAEAISGFRGNGERNENNLSRLADEFDTLARVDDVSEIRRRLRDQVGQLREAVQEMRRENEKSVNQFASQITAYQQRLELARKESGVDRLTGLGSRREAEQKLSALGRQKSPVSVLLFDIEGFGTINQKYGTLFGDKLLRAFSHLLHSRYPEDAALFRWGADEFLVIAEGPLAVRKEQGIDTCRTFAAAGKYSAIVDGGAKVPLAAAVASGAVQYIKGESPAELYRRLRTTLEDKRKT